MRTVSEQEIISLAPNTGGTGSVRGDCLSDFAPYGPAGAV